MGTVHWMHSEALLKPTWPLLNQPNVGNEQKFPPITHVSNDIFAHQENSQIAVSLNIKNSCGRRSSCAPMLSLSSVTTNLPVIGPMRPKIDRYA